MALILNSLGKGVLDQLVHPSLWLWSSARMHKIKMVLLGNQAWWNLLIVFQLTLDVSSHSEGGRRTQHAEPISQSNRGPPLLDQPADDLFVD